MRQRCSLCTFEVDINDPLCDHIKKRHEDGRHTRHSTISQRDGHIINNSGMGNIIIGKVVWNNI